MGKIFSNHPYFKSEGKALLIELPPYRLPSLKMILTYTFRKTGEYVKKAGTIILGILIILWALMYFPNGGDVQNSYIGKFGQAVQPIFKPAGFGDRWELVAAIPPSLIAKEVVALHDLLGGISIGGAQCFQSGLHGLGRVAAHFHQRRLEGFQIGVVLFADAHWSCSSLL
jgi:Fe2+ transport system protein B